MSAVKRLYDRAIEMMGLARGTLAADGGTPIQMVQILFTTTGGVRDKVPFMQHYGFASRPHAGCDYAVYALGGDPTKSFIVASNDQRYQIGLVEGETALFDDQAQKMHIMRDGITIADRWGNSIVTGENGVTITSCTGIITADNDIVSTQQGGEGMSTAGIIKSLQNVIANAGALQVGLATHKHSDAGGTGDSGPPVPGT
jgi:phage gp45-like